VPPSQSTAAPTAPTAPTAPPGRRERLRAEAIEQIKAAALEQVRAEGAGAVSLRGVARAVGMSAPGLYRYYASRDDLLTQLISDAYDHLTAALVTARDAAGPARRDRLRAVALAYFDWAVTHKSEWALVFGAPVPGYDAPTGGPTTQAARRFAVVFTDLVAEDWDGCPSRFASPPVLPRKPGGVLDFGGRELPDDPRFLGVVSRLWSRLHGVIALGLFGHLLPATLAPESVRTLYEAEVDDQLHVLGL